MANTLLTNDIIAKLILMEFKNNLVLAKTANRHYENIFSTETGATVRVRRPTRLLSQDGPVLSGVQNIQQRYTNLTIDHYKTVPIQLTSTELTLQLDDFQANVIRPAMQTLANDVDTALFNSAIGNVYNFVGTPGVSPASFAVANQANSKLNSFGVPRDNRYMVCSETDGGALQSSLYNTFNKDFNTPIILDSSMGRLAGFEFYTGQNVQRPSARTGTFGSPLVNGAGQTGTSLIIDGVTANTVIKKGAVFTIAGVDSVNPISYVDTTNLANFVVTVDATADGSGNVTLQIAAGPSEVGILTSGAYQNVTVGPADNAVISFQDTHTMNLGYHSEAFTLAMINLYSPPASQNTGAYFKNLVDDQANIALRMVRQYNITQDADIIRVDALFGTKCFGEYACQLMGS